MGINSAAQAWMPWIAGAAGALLVGGAVGASGIVGHESTTVVEIGAVSIARSTPAFSCPGGAEVSSLDRGARVLAQSRNDDASWVSVRDPRAVSSSVWVPAALVTVDDGEGAIADLPLGAPCPTVSLPPLPVEEAPPAPAPVPAKPGPAKPGPTKDATAPTISAATASPSPICTYDNSPPYAWVSTVSIAAADNVGVTGASISWSGVQSGGPVAMTGSGGSWSYSYNPPSAADGGTVTFSIQVRDAAGNLSSVATATVTLDDQCLI